MLANSKPNKSTLSLSHRNGFSELRAGLQAGQDGIGMPAMPEAVAQLQLLAASHIVDLQAITDVIRNDVGLTVQLLQLVARNLGKRAGSISNLEELVVHLGLEQLRTMAAESVLLAPLHQRR